MSRAFTREELDRELDLRLLTDRSQDGPCVSIFLPTPPAQIRQHPIRLRNLLRQAEVELAAGGLSERDVERLLKPCHGLHRDLGFWQNTGRGLALYISHHLFRAARLPIPVEELVVIADRFHIKPVLPVLTDRSRFFLLALSRKNLRLFRGDRFHLDPVELKGVPTCADDIPVIRERERHLQFHTGAQPAAGRGRAAVFHGHGEGKDDAAEELADYFHFVEPRLRPHLGDEAIPLVVAGLDQAQAVYREINRYPYLLEERLSVNPDPLDAAALHEKAWPLVEPLFTRKRQEAAEQYGILAGRGRASDDPEEVVPAAATGRVETLFVRRDERLWGHYEACSHRVVALEGREPGSEDLLDRAVVETLSHGGAVYVAEADEMPTGGPMAAIFRY